MGQYRVISSDSHVVEPPDLWIDRMDPKFGDRIPRLVKGEDSVDRWYVDNKPLIPAVNFSQAGLRFEHPEEVTFEGEFEEVPLGGYDPHAHIKDMEQDGVWGSVVYPSVGLFLFSIPTDEELLRASIAAYNDWLADFCKPYPDRLKGIAMVLLDDNVEAGISELERTAKMGLAGAMISVYPSSGQYYDLAAYDPFWAAAQNLDMSLSLHVATNRPGSLSIAISGRVSMRASDATNTDHWPRQSLCDIIYSGVFERYPRLKVVNVEHELAWLPFFIRRMDFRYKDFVKVTPYRFKGDTLPSDFMRSNVYHSFQEDDLGIRDRHIIGVDNIMWGSDYPHPESTFPRSQHILDQIMEGVPGEERAKLVGGNAAKLFKFD